MLDGVRVWAPIAARGAAIGLALLGLAAIGAALQLPPMVAPAAGPAGVELSSLGGQALGPGLGHTAEGAAPEPGAPSTNSRGAGSPGRARGAAAAFAEAAASAGSGSSSRAPGAPAALAEVTAPSGVSPGRGSPRGSGAAAAGALSGAGPPAKPAGGAGRGGPPCPERPAPEPGLTADGRVILNQAGVPALQRLPGIGARRAEAIVALRERLGRFRRVEDLLRVRGIGRRMLERLRPQLVLDAPSSGGAPQAGAAPASG